MVVVRSYFSGSLCCPMLKGFTVNRSCSTCTVRTVEFRNTCTEHHNIKLVLYDAVTQCTIMHLLFVHNPAALARIYICCSAVLVTVKMTLLPHAARYCHKPILLLHRKKTGNLSRKNEWWCAHALYVNSLSVKQCCFTGRRKNRLSSNQHRASVKCRQRMIIYSQDACVYVVSKGNDRHIG